MLIWVYSPLVLNSISDIISKVLWNLNVFKRLCEEEKVSGLNEIFKGHLRMYISLRKVRDYLEVYSKVEIRRLNGRGPDGHVFSRLWGLVSGTAPTIPSLSGLPPTSH